METGTGLFFLAIGIAFAGYCIGSGLDGLGDGIREGFRELSQSIGYLFDKDG